MIFSLLLVVVSLQVSCSQHAIKIEKVVVERDTDRFATAYKTKSI